MRAPLALKTALESDEILRRFLDAGAKMRYYGIIPREMLEASGMNIIWDWNGTLLDDVNMAVRVTNEVFSRYGYRVMDADTYRARFRFPVIAYYRECGVKDEDFPQVASAWSDAYLAAFPGTPLQSDAAETVRRFHDAGFRQMVLSASRLDNLQRQVGSYPELQGMFEELYGIGDIYAGGKIHLAQELMTSAGLDPSETVFLGDSCHDAEVAAAVSARCLLIAKGHQTRESLEKAGVPVLPDLRCAAELLLHGPASSVDTERLHLSALTMDMAEAFHRISLDEANGRFVPDEVFSTVADAREALGHLMAGEATPGGPFVRAVSLRKSGEIIGHVGVSRLGEGWEIGYHIAEAHRGHGYAREAVSAYLPRVAEALGIDEVLGVALTENRASCHVLEGCGFTLLEEGPASYQGKERQVRRYVWRREGAQNTRMQAKSSR